MEKAPLILTLTLDQEAQGYFNQLRKEHFPRERNYLEAHLTLFHHLTLPEQELLETLQLVTEKQKLFALQVTGLMSLGRGVAFKIESETLKALHAQLQQRWLADLTAQDKQKLRPHITIQNKVEPATAKALERQLQDQFIPFSCKATGLTLYEYKNGPWEFLQQFNFTDSTGYFSKPEASFSNG